jgi:hypothetical protein
MRALLGLLLLLVLAPAAAAQDSVVDRAAQALRSDPVHVDPAAEMRLSASDADALRRRIDQGAGPMYVAILPDAAKREAGGSAEGAIRLLADRLARPGVYAVVVGTTFRAGSTDLPSGVTAEQATAALREHRDEGVAATLLAFTDRMADVRAGRTPDTSEDSGGGGGGLGAPLLAGLLALGGGALLVGRRRRRAAEAVELAELKANVRDDLVALGDDIRALDLDMEMPGTPAAAKADYARAVDAYDQADTHWERARRPEDFEPIGALLEEGRYAMTAAKSRVAGEPVPERTPPCFFDPRHGPSAREVEWAPYGGTPRPVPACEADAQRVERGEDPQSREVTVGGRQVPYWNAGPMYAPFAGGFFAGGLFPGLFIGTMLGDGLDGWGGDAGGGSGDFGGGFGGGDFGGGGGDFGGGGGDFGGGGF